MHGRRDEHSVAAHSREIGGDLLRVQGMRIGKGERTAKREQHRRLEPEHVLRTDCADENRLEGAASRPSPIFSPCAPSTRLPQSLTCGTGTPALPR